MCGLIGKYSAFSDPDAAQKVRNGMEKLRHRGPDDEGFESIQTDIGTLYLGHTRLSIIDLSPLGRQPMRSEDGRFHLIFNGEIYNYVELRQELISHGIIFTSDSDSEVLLQCWVFWGKECLQKLTGMFAFTLFDRRHNKMFCVRDAFGIKPFFYSLTKDTFSFASEIAALLEINDCKPTLNPTQTYDFLVYGEYDRDRETFFKNIQKLLPGEILSLEFTPEGIKRDTEQWWYPTMEERKDLSFKDAAEELRERFLQNIRLHLRSDVPLGAALSGGIDSSAVVCAMRHLEPDMPIHTFSYIARGYELDEEKWVDIVNGHVNAIPQKVVVEPGELVRDIETLVAVQGEPFSTTNIYAQYRVVQLAKEHGITVTMHGQGADEMLAGYEGYPDLKTESLIYNRDFAGLLTFVKHWPDGVKRNRSVLYRTIAKAMLPESLQKTMRRKKHLRTRYNWLSTDWFHQQGVNTDGDSILIDYKHKERKVIERLRAELLRERIPRLLRYEDRNSMYWSIESRVPFLTTDLAQFMMQLPEKYLISDRGVSKNVFREAMRGIVPDPVLNRKDKIGFDTPGRDLLKGLLPDIDRWLEPLSSMPFMDAGACRSLIEETATGKKPFSWESWRILCFARWAAAYNVRY